MIDRIIEANPGQVAAYRGGKEGLLGFFVGQVMKETRRQGERARRQRAAAREARAVSFRGLAAAVVERVAPYAPAGVGSARGARGLPARRARRERAGRSFALDEPELDEEIDPSTYDPPYPAFAVLEALDFLQEFVRNELERGVGAGRAVGRASRTTRSASATRAAPTLRADPVSALGA